jgi:hypothetical protein
MAFSLPSTTGFNFKDSLSASEKIDTAKYFVAEGAAAPSLWEKAKNLNLSIEDTFGPNAPDLGSLVGLNSSEFLGGLAGAAPPSWTFITAPEDVSWDIANNAQRVDIFGTNNPPVVAGSRGMRDLTLGNALVEGFVRNIAIEGKIAALEQLMNYNLNSSDGYVSVPVYQVWASEKSYGGPDAYYIIKDVRIKETMRDLKGNATRAYVDISLMQVPKYQVGTGRDQASQVTAGGVAVTAAQGVAEKANQQVQGAASKGGTPATNPASKPAAGPSAGGSAQPATPSKGFQGAATFDPRTGAAGAVTIQGPPSR